MNAQVLSLPKVECPLGNYAIIEGDIIAFPIKRVYYLYDIPAGAERGGHSHINQLELLVASSGSFDVILKDGTEEVTISLNNPNESLLIREGIWRELNNFSSGAVCLVMASDVFDETDYIREYNDYLKSVKA